MALALNTKHQIFPVLVDANKENGHLNGEHSTDGSDRVRLLLAILIRDPRLLLYGEKRAEWHSKHSYGTPEDFCLQIAQMLLVLPSGSHAITLGHWIERKH